MKSLSRVLLFATPWTAAYQAPPSMGFSRKSTGVGCHFLLHEWFYEDLKDLLELRPKKKKKKKDVLFITGDWNAKVGSQEIPGVTGRFGLGEQSEPGQRLTEFCQENALHIANTLYQQHERRLYM